MIFRTESCHPQKINQGQCSAVQPASRHCGTLTLGGSGFPGWGALGAERARETLPAAGWLGSPAVLAAAVCMISP